MEVSHVPADAVVREDGGERGEGTNRLAAIALFAVLLGALPLFFLWDTTEVYRFAAHSLGGLGWKVNRAAFVESGLFGRAEVLLGCDIGVVILSAIGFVRVSRGSVRDARRLAVAAFPVTATALLGSFATSSAVRAIELRPAAAFGSKTWAAADALWLSRGHASVGALVSSLFALLIAFEILASLQASGWPQRRPADVASLLPALTLLFASIGWLVLDHRERGIFVVVGHEGAALVARRAARLADMFLVLEIVGSILGLAAIAVAFLMRRPAHFAITAVFGVTLFCTSIIDRETTRRIADACAVALPEAPIRWDGELPRSSLRDPRVHEHVHDTTVVRDRHDQTPLPGDDHRGQARTALVDRTLLVRDLVGEEAVSINLLVAPTTRVKEARYGSLASIVTPDLDARFVRLLPRLDAAAIGRIVTNQSPIVRVVRFREREPMLTEIEVRNGATVWAPEKPLSASQDTLSSDTVLMVPPDASIQLLVDDLDALERAKVGGGVYVTTRF